MSIVISKEKYVDIIDDMKDLLPLLSKEVDLGHSYEPDVDHEQIIAIEDMGVLHVVTARKDGELVGFHISTIQDDIFYKTKKTAFVLFYFLRKDFRGKGGGFKMFKFADDEFKNNGAKRAFMSRKTHIKNERMFDALGYNQIEANYEKYYE